MIVKLPTSRRFVSSSSVHRVQVVELAARVVREHGLPDLVVNNAGCYYIQHFRCEPDCGFSVLLKTIHRLHDPTIGFHNDGECIAAVTATTPAGAACSTSTSWATSCSWRRWSHP